MKLKVAGAVVAVWTLVGLVWGSHMTFEASLQGNPASFRDASPTAFINALSWIPATLIIVWLTLRFPVRSGTWRTHLWVHLLAFPAVAYLTHVFVVLGFWSLGGSFQGLEALAGSALFWTSLRIHIAAVVYVVVLGVTQGLTQFRDGQARELRIARLEGQLAKARMDALNAQLRPHFLFNTLHTIGHLWRSGRADEADALLDHLGSLFERVQATTSEPRVPLAEEIRMVDDYLAIESARFHDRLVVTKSVSPEALPLLVPPLMLQPLIENAIRHGISQSSSAGRISLVAHRANGVLEIQVDDDGPGLREDAPSRGTGTGLTNLQQRLEELYGGEGELRLSNRSEGGARVQVRIPVGGEIHQETAPVTQPDRVVSAVIVDDEPAAREVLRSFLGKEPRVEVLGDAGNGVEAVSLVREANPDLLFLDVQMPDLDGFGVLERLGDAVPPGVVFVTAHDEHALRAFEVHAVDYLLKPFGPARFGAALEKALNALAARDALDMNRTWEALAAGHRSGGTPRGEIVDGAEATSERPRRIGVRTGNRIILVDVDTVDWVEADGDHVRVHAGDAIHLVSRSLRDVSDLLGPEFIQIHRSVIVRMSRIGEIRRESDGGGIVKLTGGVQLRLARARWETVGRALGLVE